MPKVHIINSSDEYVHMFGKMGWEVVGIKDFFNADLIQFTGGSDVTPMLYGESLRPKTYCSQRRDLEEAGYFAFAQRCSIPMAGICRGGQFLNVMNGGKMYQHVDGHATGRNHILFDRFTSKYCNVTSTHHQMMIPHYSGEVIAIANESKVKESYDSVFLANEADVEVVYYDNTKSLCFQPHPEFYNADSTRDYYFELINRYLGLKA